VKRLLVVLAVLVLLLAACGGSGPAADEEPLSGPARETEALFKDWLAAAQSLDLERMMSHYADEVAYGPSEEVGSVAGRESVKEDYEDMMGRPGIKLGMKDYFISSDGRWVAGEGTASWTLAQGGTTYFVPGLLVFEFFNGKIVRETHYFGPMVAQSGN
jgi:hypothetical protein